MGSLFEIAKSGIQAYRQALSVTGQNIANVNTEGYSRQRVVQTTSTPINKQGLIQGTGTRIVSVERTHDPFVEKRLQRIESELSYKTNFDYSVVNDKLEQATNKILDIIQNEIEGVRNVT